MLAGTILQFKSLLDAFVHLPGLTGVGGDDPQFSPRDGKIWIKFDGALVMGNGALVIEVLVGGVAEAIGLQSFERRSGGLLQRRGEFLNGRQRLAQLASETGGGFVEGLEDLFFALGFSLFARQRKADLLVGLSNIFSPHFRRCWQPASFELCGELTLQVVEMTNPVSHW